MYLRNQKREISKLMSFGISYLSAKEISVCAEKHYKHEITSINDLIDLHKFLSETREKDITSLFVEKIIKGFFINNE